MKQEKLTVLAASLTFSVMVLHATGEACSDRVARPTERRGIAVVSVVRNMMNVVEDFRVIELAQDYIHSKKERQRVEFE